MKGKRFSIRNLLLLAIALLVPTIAQAQSGEAKAPSPNPSNIPCSIIETREIVSSKLVDKYHVISVNTTSAPLQSGQIIVWKIYGDNHYADGTQKSVPLKKVITRGANFTVSAWSLAVALNQPFQTQRLTCQALVKPDSSDITLQ